MHPAVAEALKHLGERDGTPYLIRQGLARGLSWCAAFMLTCFDLAVPANHLPHSGRVHTIWTRARADRLRYEVITPRQASWGKAVQSGDVVVFSHNPDARDWLGHIGLVVEPLPPFQAETVEGNTSCPDDPQRIKGSAADRERNGNCVALKVRGVGPYSFRLMGFIRERGR